MRTIIFILISTLPLAACSSLFWRSASLPPTSQDSGNTRLTYQVVYLERDSWNPLMGTTVKKSYQTRISLQDLGDSQSVKELPNLNSWVLPGKMYYNSSSDRLFWIQGVDDEYGTLHRKAGIAYDVRTQGLSRTKFWDSEKELIHISPSPDGSRVGYIFTKVNSAGVQETYLSVWEHSKENAPSSSHKIPLWDESDGSPNPNYDLIWNGNSSLRVKLDKKSLTWTPSGLK